MEKLKGKATELATQGIHATGVPASIAVIFIVVSIGLVIILGRTFGIDLLDHLHGVSVQVAANASYSDCNELRHARGNPVDEVCLLERSTPPH